MPTTDEPINRRRGGVYTRSRGLAMEYDRDDRALRLGDIEEHFTRFRTTNSKLEADLDKNLDVC